MSSLKLDILSHYLLPKKALTAFAGCLANIKIPVIKDYLIQDFVIRYNVNMREAQEENPKNYACFNDFFIRRLKTECRPIVNADIVSPVDGCVSEMGDIRTGKLLQAKGKYYSVHELLACDEAVSAQFSNGCFTTLYLSPKDYHRVHMPLDGTLKTMTHVPGTLFSVQPKTVQAIPRLFARNERVVALFDTIIGPMAMVLVGATVVGGINATWHGDMQRCRKQQHFDYSSSEDKTIQLKKADEMGYFKLGSTVILLFAEGQRIKWRKGLKAGKTVRFGEELASM
ncbi:archaetidylserine decarboxylase [bacterium]|nr:archaetidylserine decarboxylase [bacterium]